MLFFYIYLDTCYYRLKWYIVLFGVDPTRYGYTKQITYTWRKIITIQQLYTYNKKKLLFRINFHLI